MEAVKAGELKPHAAAVKFGIPSSTLYDHLIGRSKKRYGGHPTVLTAAEEREIATACQVLQQFGFHLTTDTVEAIVQDYVTACGRETPSLQGFDSWLLTGGVGY